MAATAWKFLSDDAFAQEVKTEFEAAKAMREKDLETLPDVFGEHLC